MTDKTHSDITLRELNRLGLLVATQYVTYPGEHEGEAWSSYQEDDDAKSSDLLGLTIVAADFAGGNSFYIAFSNGVVAAWFLMQKLMDSLHVASTEGNTASLIGARLADCKMNAALENIDPDSGMRTTRFSQRFTTSQDCLAIEWIGKSDVIDWHGPILVVMRPPEPRSNHSQMALLRDAKDAARQASQAPPTRKRSTLSGED